MQTYTIPGTDCVVSPDLGAVFAGARTTPEEIAHATALCAWLLGDRPDPPTPDDFTDAACAALGTRTADVQAQVDAEADAIADTLALPSVAVPSVAALRAGGTVKAAARRAIEAIAAQTGEHAWQVAVRMRQRMIAAAAAKPAAAIEAPADGGEVGP